MQRGKLYGLALVDDEPKFFELRQRGGRARLDRTEEAYFPHARAVPTMRIHTLPEFLAQKAQSWDRPATVTVVMHGRLNELAFKFSNRRVLLLREVARYQDVCCEFA